MLLLALNANIDEFVFHFFFQFKYDFYRKFKTGYCFSLNKDLAVNVWEVSSKESIKVV